MPHTPIGRALRPGRRVGGIGPLLVALVLLASAMSAGAQTMYKWKDEKGVTHFSEHPPPDEKAQASKVTPKVTPPSGSGAYDPDAWKSKDAEARKRQIERGRTERVDAKHRERREAACNRARSRLSMLQNTQIIYRDQPDGKRTYMEDSERNAEMGRARDAIRENCD